MKRRWQPAFDLGTLIRPAARCALAGTALLPCAAAPAQTATPQAAGVERTRRDTVQLEEIVVTAQYRREPLQDVPLSITALDSSMIEAQGIDEFVDYARAVPGLTFASRGANRSEIVIRGI